MPGRPSRVRRQSSEDGSWEMFEWAPAAALRPLVRGYTGFVETSPTPLVRTEAPTGDGVLIISFGAPYEVRAPGREPVLHRDSFVGRLSELPAIVGFNGTTAGIQVDFSPLGLHLFCGVAADELPAPTIGLTELLGAEGRLLTEALADAPGWEARFDLLDAAIERRLGAARVPTPSVQWAWRVLEASAGGVEIGALAERIGCSRRHLIAGFREQIGVPPKTAARILRFDRAARLVRSPEAGSLARIAARTGYHDQAHMTREFRALAGATPAAYRAAALPGFVGVPDLTAAGPAQVNSVQDGPPAAP